MKSKYFLNTMISKTPRKMMALVLSLGASVVSVFCEEDIFQIAENVAGTLFNKIISVSASIAGVALLIVLLALIINAKDEKKRASAWSAIKTIIVAFLAMALVTKGITSLYNIVANASGGATVEEF